jgi:hypothetical protein
MKLCRDLKDIKGHKQIVKWFESCIKNDNLPQVILIDGVPGIGKSSIAKIVACEIACKDNPDKLQEYKDSVIDNDKSMPGVRLYNMSNLKSADAVKEVKADLSFGVSQLSRKVIIMDEAHGMTQEQQDSLLVSFESLQLGIYIIICTTDASSLGEAFMSRCIRRRLNGLTEPEIHTLIRERIHDNRLKFDLNLNFVIKIIASYTGNEPRRAINLLDSFKPDTLVTKEELETFVNIYEGKDIIILADYLYSGNILNGLKFIKDMDMTNTFISTLLEVVRIAYGDISVLLGREDSIRLEEITKSDGGFRLLEFAADCSSKGRITRNLISGFFLKHCNKSSLSQTPVRTSEATTKYKDLELMNVMLDSKLKATGVNDEYSDIGVDTSLEEMFEQASTLT